MDEVHHGVTRSALDRSSGEGIMNLLICERSELGVKILFLNFFFEINPQEKPVLRSFNFSFNKF